MILSLERCSPRARRTRMQGWPLGSGPLSFQACTCAVHARCPCGRAVPHSNTSVLDRHLTGSSALGVSACERGVLLTTGQRRETRAAVNRSGAAVVRACAGPEQCSADVQPRAPALRAAATRRALAVFSGTASAYETPQQCAQPRTTLVRLALRSFVARSRPGPPIVPNCGVAATMARLAAIGKAARLGRPPQATLPAVVVLQLLLGAGLMAPGAAGQSVFAPHGAYLVGAAKADGGRAIGRVDRQGSVRVSTWRLTRATAARLPAGRSPWATASGPFAPQAERRHLRCSPRARRAASPSPAWRA